VRSEQDAALVKANLHGRGYEGAVSGNLLPSEVAQVILAHRTPIKSVCHGVIRRALSLTLSRSLSLSLSLTLTRCTSEPP